MMASINGIMVYSGTPSLLVHCIYSVYSQWCGIIAWSDKLRNNCLVLDVGKTIFDHVAT